MRLHTRIIVLPLGLAVLISVGCKGSSGADAAAGTDADTDVDTDCDSDADAESYPEGEDPAVDWVLVPAGSFTFGSPVGTPCRGMYTEKQVPVTLTRPFLISKYEITQKQWKALGFDVPQNAEPCDECPITFIDQLEAMMWCNALSHLEGLETCYDLSCCTGTIGSGCPETFWDGSCSSNPDGPDPPPDVFYCEGPVRRYESMYECNGYRLPTGPEWEYAAKAGTTTNTYNGDVTDDHDGFCGDDPVLNDIAWYCFTSGAGDTPTSEETPSLLRQVGLKQPNAFGLYDMLGNAWEWADYVGTGLGLDANESKPDQALTDPMGAPEDDDTRRDLRGGDFKRLGCNNRSADQFSIPGYERRVTTGFRPVRTLPDGWVDAGVGESGGT